MSNGAILYRGPSKLDGKPIVVVATGFKQKSKNAKTGGLVQTYILREDMSPTEAVKAGADASICGTCPHRGEIVDGKNVGRSCYVVVFQGPYKVWDAYQRGLYPEVKNLAELGADKVIRLGAYGDPAAVPGRIWAALLAKAKGWTGYTHQWKVADPIFARWTMASCDSEQDRIEAKAKGYRTFRVKSGDAPKMDKLEVTCPASEEAGKKLDCQTCQACSGTATRRKGDIVINVHGAKGKIKAFDRNVAP